MSAPDLPERLRAAASNHSHVDDYLRHLLRMAADELEEWRAVDHNPPPFDENGVLNDTDARAQDERRESLLRAIHDITRPEYPPENAAMIVAETHRLTSDLLQVPDMTSEREDEVHEDVLFDEAQRVSRVDGLDWDRSRGEIYRRAEANLVARENTEAVKAQHKLELNRRGWDYDEARDGFIRIALQPLEAGATDIPPDPFPWPLVPMREQYDSDEAYTRAMVAWGKAVHEIERNRET